MSKRQFSHVSHIAALPQLVWSVMVDVERWPDWTSSVARVKLISRGPLRVGSRVRIHHPNLPPAFWKVTENTQGLALSG